LPVLLFQPSEVQIAENVSQENQTVKAEGPQKIQRFARLRNLRTQMEIRKDHEIINGYLHVIIVPDDCLVQMKRL